MTTYSQGAPSYKAITAVIRLGLLGCGFNHLQFVIIADR